MCYPLYILLAVIPALCKLPTVEVPNCHDTRSGLITADVTNHLLCFCYLLAKPARGVLQQVQRVDRDQDSYSLTKYLSPNMQYPRSCQIKP